MALMNVQQVMKLLDVPQTTAYKIIRELNAELKANGYRVIRGKTVDWYLNERFGLEGLKQ